MGRKCSNVRQLHHCMQVCGMVVVQSFKGFSWLNALRLRGDMNGIARRNMRCVRNAWLAACTCIKLPRQLSTGHAMCLCGPALYFVDIVGHRDLCACAPRMWRIGPGVGRSKQAQQSICAYNRVESPFYVFTSTLLLPCSFMGQCAPYRLKHVLIMHQPSFVSFL